jgi:glycosyltransferase involved in cell wall biosynthesis
MKIGVLIPAYNEERTIGKTLSEVLQHIEDVVVVNDGSQDGTAGVVREFPVTLIDRERNVGLAKTVAEGFAHMLEQGYDYGIKLDADGQMAPERIPDMVVKIEEDPAIDIICATYDNDTPWIIRKDMRIFSRMYRLGTGIETTDYLSEFRGYNARAMRYLIEHTKDEGYASPFLLLDMHRAGLRSAEIRGGVSFSEDKLRPFPIDAQYQFKKAFVQKVYQFGTVRSKAVALASIPLWAALTVFNSTVQPKYHTFLPKRFVR